MTPGTEELPTEMGALAEMLTEARKRMILALPADGSWGAVPSRSVAKRAWWSMLPGVIDHKHCPEDANEWSLSELGLALRAHLQANPIPTSDSKEEGR